MMETVAWLSGMPKKFAVKWIEESIYVKCSLCCNNRANISSSSSSSFVTVYYVRADRAL